MVVDLLTDNYPYETSWELTIDGEVVMSGDGYTENATLHSDTLCLSEVDGQCMQFEIFDTAGDGLCCGFGEGSYTVTFGGNVVASGGEFGASAGGFFDCAPGETCNDAIPLTAADFGMVMSEGDSYWYSFHS